MKKILLLPILLLVCLAAHAQVSSDYAVMVTASVTETPPSITLRWPYYSAATGYTIYKKSLSQSSWTVIKIYNSGANTFYTDTKVIADSGYEYQVTRNAPIVAYGYIYAGIKLQATDYRGKLLLIVDSTFVDSLSSEVTQLMNDISADGWAVALHYVSRNATPPHVKSYIVSQYTADSLDVKAVLLLGHVPVPYSGYLHPDEHPDHLGAWPADEYYGDIYGIYTDSIINDDTTVLNRPGNRNVIGDGKFDQSIIPGVVKLEIGRVDLDSMSLFSKTEAQLLKQYLNRDHDYKFKNFTTVQRGLIQDDFGVLTDGEAFASCAWSNFPPMFGDTNVQQLSFFSTLSSQNYLWSYGCGGGNFQGASGIGSTSDFAADSVKTVFTMLFGSYFGDWDDPNNFLRAPLASPGLALTSCWAGRPYWYFHHMVLGKNIGYSAMVSQNYTDYAPYFGNVYEHYIHIALMGDPTLRQHVITPPSNVTFTFAYPDTSKVTLHWDASPDTGIVGYYIYRSTEKYGKYDRVSSSIITINSFVDMPPVTDLYYYYVKAVKWEYTPSGTYLNTSEGLGDSTTVHVQPSGIAAVNKPQGEFIVYPNPSNEIAYMQWLNIPQGEYNVLVKDELGRTVYSKLVKIFSSNYSLPLLVKGWPAGCYFIEAQSINNQFVQKLIVGH